MSDDKPSPLEDVRKGLGLLFRAARTTVEKLPTKDLEEVAVTTAKEVGRAIENVGRTIEREVFGGGKQPPGEAGSKDEEPPADEAPSPKPPES